MLPLPCHGAGKLYNGFHAVHEVAVPVVFKYAPTAFNRIVLAVVGRIVRKLQADAGLRHKLNEPREELRPSAVTFGTVIQIEQERLDLWKAFLVGLPPLAKNIRKAVAGDFGGHRVDRQCVITG